MEKNICKLINESKNGDKDSLLKLITAFNPLINKYKRQLNYEDAENDLIEHFIRTIKNIPLMTEKKQIKYIETSIKNKYIHLSKKNRVYDNNTVLIERSEEFQDNNNTERLSIDIKKALNMLPIRQKEIIVYHYVYGYGDQEISKVFHISRQAVHKARRKALNHLHHSLKEVI